MPIGAGLVFTLLAAFVLLIVASALLGVGYLITGKTRLKGSCGMDPNKRRSGKCGKDIACPTCGKGKTNQLTTKPEEKPHDVND